MNIAAIRADVQENLMDSSPHHAQELGLQLDEFCVRMGANTRTRSIQPEAKS